MKGQINLEFMFAALLYLSAAGGILILGADALPTMDRSVQRSNLYTEAYTVSTRLLSKPGYSTYGETSNWDKNSSTVQSTTSVGISSSADNYLVIEPGKLQALNDFSSDPQELNYSSFKRITGAENQYRFNFTWMPVTELEGNFYRYERNSFKVSDGDNLVGYWKLDEETTDSDSGPESIVKDSSGDGNDGTAYGNFGYDQPGIRGTSAYYFDSEEYARINNGFDSANATISLWMKPETLIGEQRFLKLDGNTRNISLEIEDGSANINFTNSTRTEDIYSGGVTRDWTHVAVTIYKDGNYSLYINGALKGQGTKRKNLTTISPEELLIGSGDRKRSEPDEEGFNGWLDDIRIYNRSLPAERIQTIFQGDDSYVKSDSSKIVDPYTSEYNSSGNRVRFGRERIGQAYPHFLAISHDGVYDRLYISNTWNFSGAESVIERESFSFQGESFQLKDLQNTGDVKGNAVILEQHVKTFGPEPSTRSSVITLERFAAFRGEPMKVEVLSW